MKTALTCHISEGNSKLGKIPNISLPPIVTCRHSISCTKVCYAMKAFRMYENVRLAWQRNLDAYTNDPMRYFNDISTWVQKRKPRRFRWHVGGDIIDDRYLLGMIQVAEANKGTQFLAFTKQVFVMPRNPMNLTLVYSAWPGPHLGADLVKVRNTMPIAWLHPDIPKSWCIPEDEKSHYRFLYAEYKSLAQRDEHECPGGCTDCQCFKCWELKGSVCFRAH